MIRGVFAPRVNSENLSVRNALERYINEVTPTKSPTTKYRKGNAPDTYKPYSVNTT